MMIKRYFHIFALFAITLISVVNMQSRYAYACTGCFCCTTNACLLAQHAQTQLHATNEHLQTQIHFGTVQPIMPVGVVAQSGTGEMGRYQFFLLEDFFLKKLLPALMSMAEQFTVTMMHQVTAIGTFIDAEQQMDVQLRLQRMTARAHKDYRPSAGMCTFGTNIRSLAAANNKGRLTASVMAHMAQNRNLGTAYSSGAEGASTDRPSRLITFRDKFCDLDDLNRIVDSGDSEKELKTGLYFCSKDPKEDFKTVNMDIDFNRTVMLPRTINLDFDIEELSDSGEKTPYISMARNLYGHDLFARISRASVAGQGWDEYQDARRIEAMHSVAQDTYNWLLAMKTRGTSEDSKASGSEGTSEKTGLFMKRIMIELGMPDDEAVLNHYFAGSQKGGDELKAMSYYAQMEVLAKKMYMRPEFYTGLYDTPANVRRKSVSMKAINSMLERDIYESYLRSEMMLSLVLEAKLDPIKESIIEEIGK